MSDTGDLAMNPTTELRRTIAQNLCRSILWIDEEIYPYTTGSSGEKIINYEHFESLFHPLTQELQDEGCLVHLHPFEQSTNEKELEDDFSDDSPSLVSAIELSKKADVIILDWHLGSADTPENSIKILEALLEEPATRIVLILSQNADKISKEVSDYIRTHPESNLPPAMQEGNACFHAKGKGLHLKVLRKTQPDTSFIKAADIIEAIFDLLSKSYPDYLHWAALEISAKIREHIPDWLHSLPTGTDVAVLQELLDERSELRTYLPANLFENLVCAASASTLKSLGSENTQREHWENPPPFVDGQGNSRKDNYINIKRSAKNLRDELPALVSESSDDDRFKQWFEAQHVLVEFCETMPAGSENPLPGAVYRENDQEEEPAEELLVCASQACDCIRSTSLLFIKAVRCDEVKAGSTSFRFSGNNYRNDPKAKNLVQLDVGEDRSITGYKKVGQIRPQIATRIISRFWRGTTRPAVNHPTFVRALRAEEA